MKEKRVINLYFKDNSKLNNDDYNILLKMTKEAASIYNYCNYIVRQKFFSHQKNNAYDFSFYFEYEELKPLIYKYLHEDNLFTSTLSLIICRYAKLNNYSLNSKMVQGVYRKLNNNWKSYFSLLKKKREGEYNKAVNIPNYTRANHFEVDFNIQTISKRLLKSNRLGITILNDGINIPSHIKAENITSFTANYKKNRLIIGIIYEKEVKENINKLCTKKKTASIDLGVNILAAVTFNFNMRPVIVTGKDIKSINQYYNKRVAIEQSLLPKNTFWSKKLDNITMKRNLYISNLIHYKANLLIRLFKKLEIKQVIIGKNKNWKQNVNLGKTNNQKFVNVPFEKFVSCLEYKLKEEGIFMYRQEESYTSKANFLNNDIIPNLEDTVEKSTFTGRRISRSLYKDTSKNRVIHADINGSYNIMRKANVGLLEPLTFLNKKYIFPVNINNVI